MLPVLRFMKSPAILTSALALKLPKFSSPADSNTVSVPEVISSAPGSMVSMPRTFSERSV